jgi:hypothetical protein
MRRLFLAALLVSSPALAQDEEPVEGENVQYAQVTEVDFLEVDVNGQIVKPSVIHLQDRRIAKFNPLIRLRSDFTTEMAASVDEIK